MGDHRANGKNGATPSRSYSIEDAFKLVLSEWRDPDVGPPRAEFADPVVASLQATSLSKLLDTEFERQNTPAPGGANGNGSNGATRMLKRVFDRLRGS